MSRHCGWNSNAASRRNPCPGTNWKRHWRGRERRAEFWRTVVNPMAIRLRGIDPDQALRALQPVTRWLWHPATLAVGCVWVFVTLGFALLHADTIVRRAGETEPYLSGAGMLLLPLSLGMTKVLHELGHGLACKRLGAECHELGIRFLVFTPCLYCDVSDAWMLPGKWQRIAVSVAGVWVDLLLATLAGWLWWFSQPGLFQALCGSVVVVCSFATIAFNANPLMRYDGYYALADLLEIPNLAQRANDTLTHWCRLVWGDDSRLAFRSRPMEQVGLVAYACGSWMWRMLLIGSILWLVATTLAPHHLDSLTGVLALLMLTGMVADPARQLAQRIKTPTRVPPEIRRRRVLLVATALALITAVLFIPWPHSERTPAMIEPAGADAVYVSFPGTLLRACAPGTEVSAGDEIAVLQNRELSLEIDRLQSERERSRLRLENLRRRQGGDPLAAAEIPTTEESLAAVEARLERKLEDARRLVLRAPRNGVVLPPAEKQIPVDDDRLAGWSGTPLDSRNVGCHLEMGTLICEVGNPQSREARLLVDPNQIEFIARGDTVEVLLDQCPWSPLHGTIHDVSQVELTAIPPALARHADLPVRVDERGVTRPAGTVYQARVTLDPAPVQTLLRQTGRARIQTRRISLWRRGMRALGETLGIVL
ncbi:MAG: hypothetical protein NT069_19970, partial [Planctomycetota bacterium]|nr:hypothetical protein [Planctomycetota bacterium]